MVSLETPFSMEQIFTLKSKDIVSEATLKQEYKGLGCVGENASPQLSWENAPERLPIKK